MCKVKAKIGRKTVTLQSLGYRGKKEARTPLGDLRQARMFIIPKSQARGLKVGSTQTITIAGKRIRVKVKKWGRGARVLVPSSQRPLGKVSTKRLRRVIVR